jgi:hypothetical protein
MGRWDAKSGEEGDRLGRLRRVLWWWALPATMQFSIQSASAKCPYWVRMVCGHLEIRMLNLQTVGRLYDDDLVINAGSGICAECDPAKADRREFQKRLNGRHGIGAE